LLSAHPAGESESFSVSPIMMSLSVTGRNKLGHGAFRQVT
jgi:hypothetical protein